MPTRRRRSGKLIRYLQWHQERVDDLFARQGCDPMRSGGIESANAFIRHVCLKCSGVWGYVTHANQMLARSCAKDHGTFYRVFARDRKRFQSQSG